jgi:transcriptional regulator with XRE-family HTH domain
MKLKKQNKPKALSNAKSSNDWKDRADYQKKNRAWLRKSADIALRILDALDKRRMTQVELANRLNVSRQHISKIVKGQENLTLETIARIEEVLGVALIAIPKNATNDSLPTTNQAQELDLGYKTEKKIKPIVYHSFEEKEQIEKELLATMPDEKRNAIAVSLMSIFHQPAGRKKPARKRSIKK